MGAEHLKQEQAANYAAFLRERFETQGMLAELDTQLFPSIT